VGFRSRGNQNTAKANLAQITVDLLEKSEGRDRPIAAIMQEVKWLCDDIPSVERVLYRKVQRGPPTDPPVSFRLFGDNYDDLISVSKAIEDKLATYPELINIRDNLDSGTPELRVTVKEDMAARFGLNVASIGSFIRGSFDGITATTIFKDNEEIDVIVRYAASTILTARNLKQLKIPTADGRQIPFSTVCDISEGQSIASIKRLDEKREVTVVSEAYDKSSVRGINADVARMFETEYRPKYPGIILEVGGEFAEFSNLLVDILRVFLVGVFLIYIILGTQFRSYTQPVLVLLTIPFAFVGIILYLFASGTPFSTTVLYAGVALAGIAVNDSIVLISFINDLRKKGKPVRDAVIEAAGTRFRPILLTSVTTIAGLTPTALALAGESVVWGPMASTIIFGLIFSTITALVIIPCLYGILYDRKKPSTPATQVS
jgi:multidrug efflux pump subunit AcrB